MFKLDLTKVEEPEIRLSTSVGSSKKQESSREITTSALLTMPKPLTVGSQQTVENSEELGISDHITFFLRNLYVGRSKSNRTRYGITDFAKLGKDIKVVCRHPAYLTYMQSTS